jgi:hypothetical protein
MKAKTKFLLGAGCVIALLPAVAFAQDTTTTTSTTTVVSQPIPQINIKAEGGLNQFTTKLNSQTTPGWSWGVRAQYGNTTPIGIEGAYVGSSNQVTNTGANAFFLRNGGEALLRANIMPITGLNSKFAGKGVDVQPYLAAGYGISYNATVDSSGNTINSSEGIALAGSKTSSNLPVAAGVDAYIGPNLNMGARVGYKWGFNDQIKTATSEATSQSLQVEATIGGAF